MEYHVAVCDGWWRNIVLDTNKLWVRQRWRARDPLAFGGVACVGGGGGGW